MTRGNTESPEHQVSEFQAALFEFVRDFGLLRQDETPCSMPVSVSDAHALTKLLDGPLSPSELATYLGLTRSTVTRLLVKLEERSWVRRRADANDGRAYILELTANGRRQAERVKEARRTRISELLARIPRGERDIVIRSMVLLSAACSE